MLMLRQILHTIRTGCRLISWSRYWCSGCGYQCRYSCGCWSGCVKSCWKIRIYFTKLSRPTIIAEAVFLVIYWKQQSVCLKYTMFYQLLCHWIATFIKLERYQTYLPSTTHLPSCKQGWGKHGSSKRKLLSHQEIDQMIEKS